MLYSPASVAAPLGRPKIPAPIKPFTTNIQIPQNPRFLGSFSFLSSEVLFGITFCFWKLRMGKIERNYKEQNGFCWNGRLGETKLHTSIFSSLRHLRPPSVLPHHASDPLFHFYCVKYNQGHSPTKDQLR